MLTTRPQTTSDRRPFLLRFGEQLSREDSAASLPGDARGKRVNPTRLTEVQRETTDDD
jgi:hypothetical protein